jgi:hypothetical protein
MKILCNLPTLGWLLRLEFNLNNFWIGVRLRNDLLRVDIWICVIPCLVIHYASPTDIQ